MTYYVKAIKGRDEATGIKTWLWADNDGLKCRDELPDRPVTTGHLWGWGPDVRAYLREDSAHPTRGVLLTEQQGPGWQETTVMPSGSGAFPSIVTDLGRFLRCATAEDEKRFVALNLDVVTLIAPTRLSLVSA